MQSRCDLQSPPPSPPGKRSLPQDPSAHLLSFRANPLTTQGEGRAIAHLVAVHHWHRVIVVMPTTQASRARPCVGRCDAGQVLQVGVMPPEFWARRRGIVFEWPSLIKAQVLQPTRWTLNDATEWQPSCDATV